ncbi:Ser/Thr protein kinase RdoA involved in Cpx stress response, MazF antagonist [Quadrisphaera granulorum]|uniref:Ser/Thr protein kinase RdoA (MazF antagonist) n=1 Tax=Quadrisphaera granulorum TaxID=317664 RepID=A0A316AAQ4_9ACTN|nr:phosphotransferase [Quadrisphaera granulorum]PWJ46897.1 Ser/Thr protein kinase RdoA (MazF antagonist) [Quadrisphaera granulorum]SZE98989.1 Ser/Thr protein kinase RdoA involved in Cpx stress response, MazF antagonist [Quadrisphaera granulorum]
MQPQSAAVADYLDHLAAAGFQGSPRYLGRDGAGRDVLTYLDGDVAADPPEPWVTDKGLLISVAELLRELHEASAGYAAARGFQAPQGSAWMQWPLPTDVDISLVPEPPAPELISHNDITPQNVVVRDGRAVALVDFDLAGPTSRLLEVWVTAKYWVPLRDPRDVWPTWGEVDQASRLRVFVDAYGLSTSERETLVEVGAEEAVRAWWRMRGAAEHLGGGWARMWSAGSGEAITRRRAWIERHADDLTRAMQSRPVKWCKSRSRSR